MAITGVDAVPTVETRSILNRMNSHAHKVQLGDKVSSMKVCLVGKYDFAVQGGATGLINLLDSKGAALKVPANFVCTNVLIDRVTSPGAITSGTISLGLNSTADVLAALAMTTFDGTSLLAGIPVGTAATAIKIASEATLTATISTTALVAGKFYVSVEGYLSRGF